MEDREPGSNERHEPERGRDWFRILSWSLVLYILSFFFLAFQPVTEPLARWYAIIYAPIIWALRLWLG